jgi:UDP-N-acetylmuramoyl-tripeptide--D-alanyl-D-alanine ligase
LTRIAAGHRATMTAHLTAITGSTGKTTVKEMLADLLATRAPTARTHGNWNNDLGVPLSLLTLEAEHRFGVFEVGMNHPGELDPLCALLRPQAAIVTSVGPVHIEYFQSEEAIAHEKAAVVRAVGPDGVVVLPADDRWIEVLRRYARSPLLTTSLVTDADYRAVTGAGLRFTVHERRTGDRVEFHAPSPGDYIVHDALLAIALGRYLGLAWEPMVQAIAAYQPVGFRWRQETVGEVTVINDAYNANPMSMRAALQAFARLEVTGRRWLVLGSMRELGRQARAEHLALGREIAQGAWAGLLALGNEGAALAEGAQAAGWPEERARVCANASAAAAQLRACTRPGDAVLVKASRGEKLENVLTAWRSLGEA